MTLEFLQRSNGRCKPKEVLTEMARAGQLSRLVDSMGPGKVYEDGLGNCLVSTVALMNDLAFAGKVYGWKRVTGSIQIKGEGPPYYQREPHRHAWLECSGWAIDCGCGDGVVSISKKAHYLGLVGYPDIASRMDWPKMIEWLDGLARVHAKVWPAEPGTNLPATKPIGIASDCMTGERWPGLHDRGYI